MLKIRRITLKDKSRVFEICKDIWDGDDYLHLVFDKWVNDKNGEFVAALDGNNDIVGFEKLTMFNQNDAWIEGLRKDQKCTIKGVGRFITDYFLTKLAKNPEIKTIRFCTYIDNVESIGLFTKIGFKILEKRHHKYYHLPQLGFIPQYKDNKAEVTTDKNAILEYLYKSQSINYLQNGICLSWSFQPISDQLIIKEFIELNKSIALTKNDQITALCLYTIREEDDLFISFFSANDSVSAHKLFQKIKQIAYQNGQKYIKTILSAKDPELNELFANFKFKSIEAEEDVLLFDYSLDLLKNN